MTNQLYALLSILNWRFLMRNKSLILVSSILLSILLTTPSHAWLIYHKPAFKGKVIDAETKQPIEGAVVVIVYERIVAGLGTGWSAFPFDIRETLTNSEGIFQIPSYTTVIHPFSFASSVNIIIFKPGYGSYPQYQKVPDGIGLDDQEIFFSEDFGKERKVKLLRGSIKEGNGPKRQWVKVTFGVVELPKLTTREELRLSIPSLPSGLKLLKKQKNLIRLINEEEEYLGLKQSNPYKARDFILHREVK